MARIKNIDILSKVNLLRALGVNKKQTLFDAISGFFHLVGS